MRLAWLTDIHLDWLEPEEVERLFAEVGASGADGVVVTGDVALAGDALEHLEALARRAAVPVWFVLGNHDYYDGTLSDVRARATALTRRGVGATWMPATDVVDLTPDTALVGHDAWCDGRAGTGAASTVVMNDAFLIGEFAALLPPSVVGKTRGIDGWWDEFATTQPARFDLMRRLAAEGATHLERVVRLALERHRHVVVLTHFPPFAEACWYRGTVSDPDWLPHLAATVVGDVLEAAMTARPDREMTVLSGHTHTAHERHILPNLTVRTGAARYGRPVLQDVVTVT